jgi:predicted DNA-binding protein with PD1-like motif
VPTHAHKSDITLQPGSTLLDALAEQLGDCQGAVATLTGGAFGPFTYVIPSLSKTPDHAAFYSDPFTPAGQSEMDHARLTYGTRDGKPWLHCHGFWTEADGKTAGGHVIPDQTLIAAPIQARIWRLEGAAFVTRHDPETNFSLLAPEPAGSPGPCHAIRLRPNQDLCTTLEGFCADHGIRQATIEGGVASIIGAVFADGRIAEPFATEIFIRSGTIAPDASGAPCATIEIGLVNYAGSLHEGVLQPGANPVLMTAELLIIPRQE